MGNQTGRSAEAGGPTGHAGSPLTVKVTRPDERTAVITPIGELDLLTAQVFSEGVAAELAARTPRVVIDLSRLSFFGSAGLSVVVDAAERSNDVGASLVVVAGRSVAARVLDITGLLAVLPIKDSLDEALAE